ncbi:MAG: tetratricopeptide repeat protein [Roseinatronobacter sp.]
MFKAILWAMAFALAQPALAQLRAADGLAALDAGDASGARDIWATLAARGDILAQHNLAVLLLTGQGGAQDIEGALVWFEAAALQGHLPAQTALAGFALERGDMDTARRWYLAAAEAGDAASQFALAKLLERDGRDMDAALHWYRAAAEQGLAGAQFALASALAEQGAHELAAEWFEAAADQGELPAMHNLAVALSRGLGRAQDEAAARALFLQAAQGGYAPSMRALALMQARGEGGAQSFRRALAWALNAAALQETGAEELVAALRDVMSDQAIAEAEAMAEFCLEARAECE